MVCRSTLAGQSNLLQGVPLSSLSNLLLVLPVIIDVILILVSTIKVVSNAKLLCFYLLSNLASNRVHVNSTCIVRVYRKLLDALYSCQEFHIQAKTDATVVTSFLLWRDANGESGEAFKLQFCKLASQAHNFGRVDRHCYRHLELQIFILVPELDDVASNVSKELSSCVSALFRLYR